MKIKILESAKEDLKEGFHFYEFQEKRFPFAIYYGIEENEVRIYAVIDCRRDPAWIRRRLQ
ncbi:MAG: hypothetical protein L6263_01860 [Desulfobacteraceae bacterium]|nr:hypothetical protein [Pseudomonadota bacterium]MCG2757165.1 hypothetical protein [Desulfobacteraceae bacterium]